MQIQFIPVQKTKSGFALWVTLTFLAVSLLVFASIFYLVSSSTIVTARNNLFNMSQAAAEGATEMAIAQMNLEFLSSSINISDPTVYETMVTNLDQTSWPVQFQISDTNGVANQISVSLWPQKWQTNLVLLQSSQFQNLYGYVLVCTITATATPINQSYQTAATISQVVQMAGIPVFQFGAFYNMDMDLSNGKPMTMNGKTFVNGNIWMYPQNTMTFNDTVSATLLVTNHDDPSDQQNLTSYTKPTYNFTANGGKALSFATAVTMPLNGTNSNPTNAESIINLPPAGLGAPNPAAYADSNQMYLYNECDLLVSNAATGINPAIGTNFTIYYQDPSGGSALTKLTNETCTFSNAITHTNIYTTNSPYAWNTNYIKIAAGFPWLTNVTFYDYRESDMVKAVQIDVARFNLWLNDTAFQGYKYNQICGGANGTSGTKFHYINSIYVYNNIPSLSGSPGQLPAVRVIDGTNLPSSSGLTIATPFPLYVLGNYNIQTNINADTNHMSCFTTNTAWTWPAGLMADAITILSSNWSDSYSTNHTGDTTPNNRPALPTTVNAACLEGIVPSITVNGTKHYSGGLENFLRLLEDWSANGGETLCYNGSIVVMFPSIYATNYWIGPGTYYNVPTRMWGFDANFTQQGKQPPGTPKIKAMIRGQWSAQ
jgi:hypothetical protein